MVRVAQLARSLSGSASHGNYRDRRGLPSLFVTKRQVKAQRETPTASRDNPLGRVLERL